MMGAISDEEIGVAEYTGGAGVEDSTGMGATGVELLQLG
jgi:hypothetical protein